MSKMAVTSEAISSISMDNLSLASEDPEVGSINFKESLKFFQDQLVINGANYPSPSPLYKSGTNTPKKICRTPKEYCSRRKSSDSDAYENDIHSLRSSKIHIPTVDTILESVRVLRAIQKSQQERGSLWSLDISSDSNIDPNKLQSEIYTLMSKASENNFFPQEEGEFRGSALENALDETEKLVTISPKSLPKLVNEKCPFWPSNTLNTDMHNEHTTQEQSCSDSLNLCSTQCKNKENEYHQSNNLICTNPPSIVKHDNLLVEDAEQLNLSEDDTEIKDNEQKHVADSTSCIPSEVVLPNEVCLEQNKTENHSNSNITVEAFAETQEIESSSPTKLLQIQTYEDLENHKQDFLSNKSTWKDYSPSSINSKIENDSDSGVGTQRSASSLSPNNPLHLHKDWSDTCSSQYESAEGSPYHSLNNIFDSSFGLQTQAISKAFEQLENSTTKEFEEKQEASNNNEVEVTSHIVTHEEIIFDTENRKTSEKNETLQSFKVVETEGENDRILNESQKDEDVEAEIVEEIVKPSNENFILENIPVDSYNFPEKNDMPSNSDYSILNNIISSVPTLVQKEGTEENNQNESTNLDDVETKSEVVQRENDVLSHNNEAHETNEIFFESNKTQSEVVQHASDVSSYHNNAYEKHEIFFECDNTEDVLTSNITTFDKTQENLIYSTTPKVEKDENTMLQDKSQSDISGYYNNKTKSVATNDLADEASKDECRKQSSPNYTSSTEMEAAAPANLSENVDKLSKENPEEMRNTINREVNETVYNGMKTEISLQKSTEAENDFIEVRLEKFTVASCDLTAIVQSMYGIKGYPEKQILTETDETFKEKLFILSKGAFWQYPEGEYLVKIENSCMFIEKDLESAIMLPLKYAEVILENNALKIDNRLGRCLYISSDTRDMQELKEVIEMHSKMHWKTDCLQLVHYPLKCHKNVVIVDLGSCSTRAGILMDQPTLPSLFFPTICATHKETGKNVYGMEALHPEVRQHSNLSFPVRPSVKITKHTIDIDLLEGLFRKIFHDLHVDQTQYIVQVCLPRNLSINAQSALIKLLLENLKVKAVSLTNQALLTLYAHEICTAIVVDIGDRTDVLPVVDGFIVEKGVTKLPYGSQRLIHHMKHSLAQKHVSLSNDVDSFVVQYVIENLCYVTNDFDKEMEMASRHPEIINKTLSIPSTCDLQKYIVLDDACFKVPEGLFNPELWGLDSPGVQHLVNKAIQATAVDVRKQIAENIYISGGVTMLPGFVERLSKEVSKLSKTKIIPKVHASNYRYHCAFIGACKFAQMDVFPQVCINLIEYETNMMTALKKCALSF